MAATANPRARLEHILFHIEGVSATIRGVDYETYTSVYHMERTVERAVCERPVHPSPTRLAPLKMAPAAISRANSECRRRPGAA
jgi:hypothetical protein